MVRAIYTALFLALFMALETVFVALSTGYLFIQLKSPLLEGLGFYMGLARDEFLMTLKLVLLEKPLLIIQSQHKQTGSVIWSLHYYSLTLLIHLGLALALAEIRLRQGTQVKYEFRFLAGSLLVAMSSLYLFLGSCCTGGPNWVIQTWLMAVVFNPITSSNATILLYQNLKEGFVILQLLSGALGVYLLLRYRHKAAWSGQHMFRGEQI